ncbi:expressed unknown protein [Seminavis robusta]|uniref:MYND-type domain-containing protein n=1 Tax=Seminavis robusta TaxID=568900 RepID=A0A9N8HW52_9STRA|nr:expressed unknown protein [Seminavis robusta]|eukprot:Sro2528_g330380.1 n/a (271) ;mRNA; f:11330-12142
MLCPACNRCTAVWGLSLEENSSEEVVASCIACNTAHRKLDLPLDEEENLEKQVQSIFLLGGSPVEKIHDLQARVLKTLGGAHWTAAALMELRYRKDPMVNGFTVMQWGEAEARWRRLAVAEIPWLYYMSIFALGNGCKPHLQRQQGQTVFALAGRRYWNECYEFCRKFWGEEDQDVQNMEAMFERCRTRRSRPDVVVCTYNKCVKAIDDRVGGAGPNLKRCAACGLARYCDKACQKSDWHDHQEVCKKVGALKDLEAVKEWLNTHPTHFG